MSSNPKGTIFKMPKTHSNCIKLWGPIFTHTESTNTQNDHHIMPWGPIFTQTESTNTHNNHRIMPRGPIFTHTESTNTHNNQHIMPRGPIFTHTESTDRQQWSHHAKRAHLYIWAHPHTINLSNNAIYCCKFQSFCALRTQFWDLIASVYGLSLKYDEWFLSHASWWNVEEVLTLLWHLLTHRPVARCVPEAVWVLWTCGCYPSAIVRWPPQLWSPPPCLRQHQGFPLLLPHTPPCPSWPANARPTNHICKEDSSKHTNQLLFPIRCMQHTQITQQK